MWRAATKIIEESDCRHFASKALIFFMVFIPVSPRFSAASAVGGSRKHRPQCLFERPVRRHPVHRPRQCQARSMCEEFVSSRQTPWHRHSQQEPESQRAQGTDLRSQNPPGYRANASSTYLYPSGAGNRVHNSDAAPSPRSSTEFACVLTPQLTGGIQ